MVENGAASDILKLGLVSLMPALHPEYEAFRLTEKECGAVIGLMGHRKRGLLRLSAEHHAKDGDYILDKAYAG